MMPGCYWRRSVFRIAAMLRARHLLPLLALAGCAQPLEGRVAARLYEAGLPHSMADCMAKRWVDRLNVFQLRKIQRLTDGLKRERAQSRLTPLRLIERVRAMNDPEILEVVSTSTARCALKL
jgi:hypothetical protein